MPSTSPSLSELASRLVASETERFSLATQLAETQRDLWTERALRRFPSIEGAVDLIPDAEDEATFLASAERLAIYATSR